MRKIVFTIIFIILAFGCVSAQSKRTALPKDVVAFDESKYSYPSDLLKVPAIEKRIRRLLGKKYDGFIEAIYTQEPIEKTGDFIVAKGCANGLCTIMEAVLVIDVSSNSIHCGIFDSTEKPKYKFYSKTPKKKPAILREWANDVIRRGK